jgi:hypothetical protein
MDSIADAHESPDNSGKHFGANGQIPGGYPDNTMEENSNEDSQDYESSSDYSLDANGQRYKKQYQNEQEKKVAKMRKMIKKMKTNIGQFHKENTIGDLLPYN